MVWTQTGFDVSDGEDETPELASPTRRSFTKMVIQRQAYSSAAADTGEQLHKTEVRSVFGWTDPTQEDDGGSPQMRQQVNIPAHQRRMPKLGVPDLDHTMKLYLKSLEPLLLADEFDQAEAEVDELIGKDGSGPGHQLQERLLQLAADPSAPSWIEKWWDDGYLCSRDPIAINVNYFFGFEDDPAHRDQIGRAAGLLHGALTFFQKLKLERLTMDMERDKPLCMSQMLRVFCASRVPAQDRDYIETYTGEMPWWLERVGVSRDALATVALRAGTTVIESCPEDCGLRPKMQVRSVGGTAVCNGTEFHAAVSSGSGSVEVEVLVCESATSTYVNCKPRHVVVLFRSRFFAFDVFQDDTYEKLMTIRQIEDRLVEVVALSEEPLPESALMSPISPPGGVPPLPTGGPPAGAFTTMDRDKWAATRERLIAFDPRGDGANKRALQAIQQSIILLALDEIEPVHDEELARVILHGDGTNRWFDRHTIIVCKNGRAGINFEHSVGDGATTLRVADEMFKHSQLHSSIDAEIRSRVAAMRSHGLRPARNQVSELQMCWSPELLVDLKRGMKDFEKAILNTETDVMQFRSYGGAWIKRMAKMSPDAFVQVAMQLAYFKLFGRTDATYEAASTRQFLHGRTEVVRSATIEAREFCEAACSTPLCYRRTREGDGDLRKAPRQYVLLKRAVEAHVAYMREAKAAQGVDRHLLGLCMSYKDNQDALDFPLPTMFRDDPASAYRRSTHWNLSTSHCGSPSLNLFGFGPVVYDGFGVGYMIKNEVISFTITSKYTGSSRSAAIYSTLLEEALLHLKAIVLASPEHVRAPPRSRQFNHPGVNTDIQVMRRRSSQKDPARGSQRGSAQQGDAGTPLAAR
eukprot:TRINITY_DN61047_c0_g1_i1.p1 TRINITY_DN61047_c0_g1~~TRINITY_DN61047_c0_g1_i1.p1  ORF type:complete len:863 (+),score=262.33 TRINITY_DN61047_c0_g1_i1:84-2672(+)